jgi:hypothetical protein
MSGDLPTVTASRPKGFTSVMARRLEAHPHMLRHACGKEPRHQGDPGWRAPGW